LKGVFYSINPHGNKDEGVLFTKPDGNQDEGLLLQILVINGVENYI
jgi:hypothetical protein